MLLWWPCLLLLVTLYLVVVNKCYSEAQKTVNYVVVVVVAKLVVIGHIIFSSGQ